MADAADHAQALEQAERDAALAAHTARMADDRRPRPAGPRDCDDCGGPIEPGRLALLPMTGRCAECAQEFERRPRRGTA